MLVLADKVTDLPWFADVLAKAQATLDVTPEHSWPSWYREYRLTNR